MLEHALDCHQLVAILPAVFLVVVMKMTIFAVNDIVIVADVDVAAAANLAAAAVAVAGTAVVGFIGRPGSWILDVDASCVPEFGENFGFEKVVDLGHVATGSNGDFCRCDGVRVFRRRLLDVVTAVAFHCFGTRMIFVDIAVVVTAVENVGCRCMIHF